MNCKEAKELVVKAGVELVNSGLIARTWGNVSCRIDEETFVITPSGREYLSLTADDIVEVSIRDLSYKGSVKPSSEKGIHAEVYRRFPGMNFVIHTHQENASAVSATGLDGIPLSTSGPMFSKEILCAKYALPGTKALRKNVVEALKKSKSNAIILKNHGALCYGKDYESTMKTAHELENICDAFINRKDRSYKSEKENQNIDPTNDHPSLPSFEARKKEILEEKGGCVIYNGDPDVIRYSRLIKPLNPFLDDFAQIIGLKVKIIDNKKGLAAKALQHSSAVFIKNEGALCWGRDEKDASAVSMILRKNCGAYFAASLFEKPKPIQPFECALMRFVYLKKYSKLSQK